MITDLIISKFIELFQRIGGLKLKNWRIRNPVWIDNPKNLSVGKNTWSGPFVYIGMQNPRVILRLGKNVK